MCVQVMWNTHTKTRINYAFSLSSKKCLMRDHDLFVLFFADQPENVRLITNTTKKVCTGDVINFTCTAEANPPVHTYLLYENDTVINTMGISGTWIKSLEYPGEFAFRCEANNSIQGIGKSGNTTLTVDGGFKVIF